MGYSQNHNVADSLQKFTAFIEWRRENTFIYSCPVLEV